MRRAVPADAAHPDLEAYLAELAAGRPFEAHEALEGAWRRGGDALAGTDAAQGLIQVAAAYVHRARRNDAGACKLTERAALRLARPCPPAAARALAASGVDPADLARRLGALPGETPAWPDALTLVAPDRACPPPA